ncbi:MAG: D-alanyl-D-alanine carboxypeptidase [Flavobacteriaceae bacterium]
MTKKLQSAFYNKQFTGVMVYNPRTKDTLVNYNANAFFTPASNTKIFTLFTALQTLGDSIPAFKYHINNDTITLQGVGNPTFLHAYFKDSTAVKMAKKYAKTRIMFNNLSDDAFGPGWAWEDYDTYFSPERTAFPIYGNVITVSNDTALKVTPNVWKNRVMVKTKKFRRHQLKNEFYYPIQRTKETEIPILMDSISQLSLWENLLPDVEFIKTPNFVNMKTAFAMPTDSVCKRMLNESDNFLAEQLLIMASSTLSDTLSSKKMRRHILKQKLQFLQDKPRWVDGSGLSRYNLFTPRSFVQILNKMYENIPKKRLFNLFPVGGQSGTLKKWYKGNPRPYMYAKSGTLSNNYALSGYLISNKGETLIFSFMNNHYRKSTSEIKKEMQVFFEYLRDEF